MAQTATKFSFGRAQRGRPSQESLELQRALTQCNVEIHQAYQSFNTTCEEELIESFVFEINALRARYNYLLRRLKETEEGR